MNTTFDDNKYLEQAASGYFLSSFKSLVKLFLSPTNFQKQKQVFDLNFNLAKAAKNPRYTNFKMNFMGEELHVPDSASFLWTYSDIFEKEIYRFEADNSKPRIIDGGANIGLSVIYFKKLYPESSIVAFEPDERIYSCLIHNISSCDLRNVEVVRKALWDAETVLEFDAEGSDAGRVSAVEGSQKVVKVPTTHLRNYLEEPVDLLKLDIEGAETRVIKDCEDLLKNVKKLFVEYHSFGDEPQSLNTLIDILTRAGFRLHICSVNCSRQPLYSVDLYNGMDMQLNIFAFRE